MYTTFFHRQLRTWQLADQNYRALSGVSTRRFHFDGFDITIQHNPARIISSAAKTDTASIARRPCFLCQANRPENQQYIELGQYQLLVNPYPIFTPHYTIAHRQHTPQRITPHISHLIHITHTLSGMAVFYNGPQCGASAPDHMHFQACPPQSLPVIPDYFRLRDHRTTLLHRTDHTTLRTIDRYLRTVICIEADTPASAATALTSAIDNIPNPTTADEPMLNLIALHHDRKYYIWLFPRQAFRPWQYSAQPPQQLLISPATVEMAGVLITPLQEHFHSITPDDIADIYSQCSLT